MDDASSIAQLSDPLISTLFLSYRRDSFEAVVLCHTEVEWDSGQSDIPPYHHNRIGITTEKKPSSSSPAIMHALDSSIILADMTLLVITARISIK
jgi:hypothetical protein